MTGGEHPRHRLDEVIHAPVRLSVVAALSAVERADFRTIRDTVEVSDSSLSKTLTALEEAGYVVVTKVQAGRRTRTWVSLTASGREALDGHLAALRAVVGHEPPPDQARGPAGLRRAVDLG